MQIANPKRPISKVCYDTLLKCIVIMESCSGFKPSQNAKNFQGMLYHAYRCLNEPHDEKTNSLHLQKQRRRSASQYCEADQGLCFCYTNQMVQFLYFLNSKFPASSHLLCLYSLFCVGPVQKPLCWFSHDAAQMTKWFSGKVSIGAKGQKS